MSRINLNLLVALEALLEEKSVTKAGKKLFITQAATSNVLKQLRVLFQDPLLEQKGREMILTARAKMLHPIIKVWLSQTNNIFNPDLFDPATSQRRFTVAIDECTDFFLVPKLYKYIETHAPHIEICLKHILTVNEKMVLESSDVDLAICSLPQYQYNELKDISYELLFSEKMVCLGRYNHPLFKNSLTLKKYLSAKHITLVPKNHNMPHFVDYVLQNLGYQRKIALRTTNLVPALYTIINSDLIATLPENLAKEAAHLFHAEIKPCPFEIPDALYVQIWHSWTELDSGCQWLRKTVKNLM